MDAKNTTGRIERNFVNRAPQTRYARTMATKTDDKKIGLVIEKKAHDCVDCITFQQMNRQRWFPHTRSFCKAKTTGYVIENAKAAPLRADTPPSIAKHGCSHAGNAKADSTLWEQCRLRFALLT
jgi:hypothetical protein